MGRSRKEHTNRHTPKGGTAGESESYSTSVPAREFILDEKARAGIMAWRYVSGMFNLSTPLYSPNPTTCHVALQDEMG